MAIDTVAKMRRTRFILALVTAASAVVAIVASAAPASAHFCAIPATIEVGEDVVVRIGVGAESRPVRSVDIEIPDGFVLKEPLGFMGYEPTRRGRWVHFEGAEIQPLGCHYFAFSGEATRKGRLVARIVTTDSGGTKTTYDDLKAGALTPPMLIFAGVTPADFAGNDGGLGAGAITAIALAAGGAAVAVAMLIRRRVTMGR